jgi:hypothetical protein
MYPHFRTAALLIAGLVLVSSCKRIPDHARHIPADALIVVGVNTGQLGKKIAWSAITGSALFERLKERSSHASAPDAIRQLDQAGIRFNSTSYMWLAQDHRFDAGLMMTLLVPLKDVAQWESYVQRVFPGIVVREREGFRAMLVEDEAVAGWNDRLLVVMNVIKSTSSGADPVDEDGFPLVSVDTVQTVAELEDVFALGSKQALIGDKRFVALEKAEHDISIWINYDAVMNRTMGSGVAGMAAMGMAGSLWQGMVTTAGIDFDKGAVHGVLKYYVSETLKEVYKAFGNQQTDREMLDRVDKQNLSVLAGWHLSTKGMKELLDRSGLSGIARLGLMETGLTVDNVFGAFTGDMVVAVNDFRLERKSSDSVGLSAYEPSLDFTYALRIDNKPDFEKLVAFAQSKGIFQSAGDGSYFTGDISAPSSVMMTEGAYAVISNRKELASDWLQGRNKAAALPEAARKAVYGHPMGMFLDVQQMAGALQAGENTPDAAMITRAGQLLRHISAYNEPFRGDVYTSRLELAFRDNSENSLLQLLDFALQVDALAAN